MWVGGDGGCVGLGMVWRGVCVCVSLWTGGQTSVLFEPIDSMCLWVAPVGVWSRSVGMLGYAWERGVVVTESGQEQEGKGGSSGWAQGTEGSGLCVWTLLGEQG